MPVFCAFLMFASVPLSAQTLDQAEALWKPQRYSEANDAFRALVKAAPRESRI